MGRPIIHGYGRALYRTKVYLVWKNMMQRCYNPNNNSYKNYGARGIGVYPDWHDFIPFLKYVGEPPTSKHSIDRINNDSGYEPGNVRWATRKEQNLNNRRTKNKS